MKRDSRRPSAAHDAEPEASPEPGRGDDEPFDDEPFDDESFDDESLDDESRYEEPDDGPALEEWSPPPLHPPEVFLHHSEPDPAVTGFYYLSGKPVPPTHPDHGLMQLLPRRPDGGFASHYYCSKEELQEWGIDHPPPLRHRHDGFTPEKIAVFIRTLRATGSVTDAARSAGITRKTAYDLYNREDAAYFRHAWDESLRGPNIVLTSTAYDRALNGVEEAVWYKGEFRGWRVRHDNRLLMWLLRVRDPLNFAPLDDLQGWLRHRDVEAHLPTEPMVDRLEAAERAWENRLPQSEAAPAFPDPGARRRAALEEAKDADPPALPDGTAPDAEGSEGEKED
jgi:hypothetical protein